MAFTSFALSLSSRRFLISCGARPSRDRHARRPRSSLSSPPSGATGEAARRPARCPGTLPGSKTPRSAEFLMSKAPQFRFRVRKKNPLSWFQTGNHFPFLLHSIWKLADFTFLKSCAKLTGTTAVCVKVCTLQHSPLPLGLL